MKTSEEIIEILEAYDLTCGLREAAVLAGCDHKTVAHYVALRDAGLAPGERVPRAQLIDEFLRPDLAHDCGSQLSAGR